MEKAGREALAAPQMAQMALTPCDILLSVSEVPLGQGIRLVELMGKAEMAAATHRSQASQELKDMFELDINQ